MLYNCHIVYNTVESHFTNATMEHIGLERLTGLIAFSRAASLGSFTAAANALSVSPSAISKSIRRLEQHLGISLFTRSTRSLTLTQEGYELHIRAQRLLKDVEEIEQTALASRREPSGILKISAPITVGTHLLGPVLPNFRKLYPNVQIDLRITDKLIDIVEEGIDVAIRIANLTDSQLLSRTLATNKFRLFASPIYLENKPIPQHPQELFDHSCINVRFQTSGQLLRWQFESENQTFDLTPDPVIAVDSMDSLAAIVAAGGGIGILAEFIAAPYIKRGELVPVLEQFALKRAPISAIWPESRKANPNVRAFLNYLYEVFPGIITDKP